MNIKIKTKQFMETYFIKKDNMYITSPFLISVSFWDLLPENLNITVYVKYHNLLGKVFTYKNYLIPPVIIDEFIKKEK